MNILNFKNPRRTVLTKRGIIDETEIYPGDILYEYLTGNELEVTGVESVEFDKMCLIKYTDNREAIIADSELVYSGKYLFYPIDIEKVELGKLYQSVLKFGSQIPMSNVDAYVGGALLTAGDLSSEYVTIESSRMADNNFDKMIGLYAAGDYGDYTAFKHKPTDEDCVKWEDYFPEFYVKEDMEIPLRYLFGSLNVRRRWLRGAFDFKYNMDLSPDDVTMSHRNINVLKNVQKVLWSCGILSYIVPEPTVPKNYRLIVIGTKAYSTEFFYNDDFVLNMLNSNINTSKLDPSFDLTIFDICALDEELYTRGSFVPGFYIKDRKHALYLNGDFLPKVSM